MQRDADDPRLHGAEVEAVIGEDVEQEIHLDQ